MIRPQMVVLGEPKVTPPTVPSSIALQSMDFSLASPESGGNSDAKIVSGTEGKTQDTKQCPSKSRAQEKWRVE